MKQQFIKHGKQRTAVYVPANVLGGKKTDPLVPGWVLETAFSDGGDYLQCKVEVTVSKPGLDGKPMSRTYIYPKPIQSYKLKRRYT